MRRKPFDYSLNYQKLNLRRHRDLYRVGKGEQGVLLVEPYKSEILPHWRFTTPTEAKKSSNKIYRMFVAYLKVGDFPGADIAKKFLQMGRGRGDTPITRAAGNTIPSLVRSYLVSRTRRRQRYASDVDTS